MRPSNTLVTQPKITSVLFVPPVLFHLAGGLSDQRKRHILPGTRRHSQIVIFHSPNSLATRPIPALIHEKNQFDKWYSEKKGLLELLASMFDWYKQIGVWKKYEPKDA